MGFSVSSPSYLYQTPSGYIFRLRVPRDLRNVVGKTEFRYSLRSGSLRVSKHRARYMASYVHQMFYEVRNTMTEYTPEKILKLVKKGVADVIHDSRGIDTAPQVWDDGKVVATPSQQVGTDGSAILPPERIKAIVTKRLFKCSMERLVTPD